MAPRRKGASKAAAAAAARRQYKVGDLVLAKVKGFPAWPATVSEPEKWGYPPDWKKVLVFFFGTQQIAFCNPSDVEAFTEEKKESLLGKRHGKGADFVRAVREIIDCYEKLKNESTNNELNYEVPTATLDSCQKVKHAAADTSGRNYSTETGLAGVVEETSCDEQVPSKEPSGMVDVMPATKTYSSRRKLNSLRPRNCATQKRGPSTLKDGILRRSKRTRKLFDDSDKHEVGSPTSLSNGSIEENDSEIVTADSDTSSFNEGSSVESGCKLEPRSHEHCEGEVEFSQKLDFHGNAVILKKKRKPNRKRLPSDSTEDTAAPVKEIDSEMNVVISGQSLPNDVGKPTERVVKDMKEDGDEHLPLFKRARVRMGMPSPVLEELDTSIQEDKRTEVCNSTAEQGTGSLHGGDSSFAQSSSPLNKDPVKMEQLCNRKFGGSLTGESALPPSKRLHRALQAMSANTSEDDQKSLGGLSKINTSLAECSSVGYCYESSDSRKVENESGMEKAEKLLRNASIEDASQFSTATAVSMDNPEIKSPNTGEIQAKVESPNVGVEEQVLVNHSDNLSTPLAALNDNDEVDAHSSKPSGEPACELHQMCSDFVGGDKISTNSPKIDGIVHVHTSEVKCDDTNNLCQHSLNESKQDNEISNAEEGFGLTLKDSCALSPPEKIMSSSQQELHQSCSSSVSDDHLGEKPVSITLSSSSLTDGLDSNARASPPNTSICNISKSEDFVLDKPKFADKMSSKREASAALAYFESILGALTRTKESIGRATRVAIDCAKFGVATKVVEILSSNLECESSLHRRVDLFFLVDSIVQCSRGLKGDIGAIYPLAIQTVLPRMLAAAAPPGSSSLENQRQCLKVLKVWQERRILPESVIRPRITELESFSSSGVYCRRSLRTERSFDDPIREMEGMMVDEYGSNSSIQLPGFCMPPMLKDEDAIDSDGEGFEAVTPEHTAAKSEEQGNVIPSTEKHRHILEDVDGELEMEDVAPVCEAEIPAVSNGPGIDTGLASDNPFVNHFGAHIHPPLPVDLPIMKDNVEESIVPQSINARAESRIPDGIQHHAPDRRGIQNHVPVQKPDSRNSHAFSSESARHPSVWVSNDMPPPEDSFKKNFRLRPPHPAPSNQFSYVQSEVQATRNAPHPSYPNRFHMHNADNVDLYRDRNDFPHRDVGEYWRTSALPSGPCYQDSSRVPYEAGPYTCPRQRSYRDHRWAHPSRPMNYRDFLPHRTPPEGPLPVTSRVKDRSMALVLPEVCLACLVTVQKFCCPSAKSG
nr:protein HUA2-LIKE 3-like isoform X1 [Ipomoea batatas]